MNNLVIKTVAKQPDEKYKISFTSTSADDSHVSGHIFVTSAEFEELTVADMKRLVADTLVRNFEGGNNSEG